MKILSISIMGENPVCFIFNFVLMLLSLFKQVFVIKQQLVQWLVCLLLNSKLIVILHADANSRGGTAYT